MAGLAPCGTLSSKTIAIAISCQVAVLLQTIGRCCFWQFLYSFIQMILSLFIPLNLMLAWLAKLFARYTLKFNIHHGD